MSLCWWEVGSSRLAPLMMGVKEPEMGGVFGKRPVYNVAGREGGSRLVDGRGGCWA